ncbi:thiolase family protein, partial [Dehalococcoidia bacterium]|nr:thiolase family protein [Dehalococcoidia bacterium]
GVVTAGNSSGINDGGAAVVLMSSEKAAQLGLEPLVAIKSYASGVLDPAYMGLGPIPAVRKALNKARLTVNDLDLIELNEAFASQVIANMRELDITWEKANPNGGGISLGHRIGCTGARMTVTTMYEMKRRNQRYGLITMCIGGGQGMAMVVERKV